MALKTLTIEIHTDHDDPAKDEIMKELARTLAKQMLTQAMLLQDKRPPQVALQSGDMFESTKEIMLTELEAGTEAEVEISTPEGARTQNAERARVAGYTVSEKIGGWKFNDPDGAWSEAAFTVEADAWEAAHSHLIT